MITVMGATGNTGGQIAESLLAAGEDVRAVGRSEEKLADLKARGAQIRVGDATDAAFLAAAFRGADAVYVMTPGDRAAADYRASQDRQGEAVARAVRDSGVRHVVALSSLGGALANGNGVIAGLHAQEERLKAIPDLNLMLLRPASFFENFREALPLVRAEGIVADAVAPDVAMPMIATRDIAAAVVDALRARSWRGVVVRELLGPRDLTHREATRIIGEALGRPDLPYVQMPEADLVGALTGVGMSRSFADLYIEMVRAMNAEKLVPMRGRTPENTTPTRLEDFAPELAREFAAV